MHEALHDLLQLRHSATRPLYQAMHGISLPRTEGEKTTSKDTTLCIEMERGTLLEAGSLKCNQFMSCRTGWANSTHDSLHVVGLWKPARAGSRGAPALS